MNIEQVKLVLPVLKNIQTCIVNRDTYIPGVGDCHNKDENYRSPFNLHVSFGLCWHVFADTPPDLGIDWEFLYPVFEELGYNRHYPVEATFMPDCTVDEWVHYRHKVNPYNGYWGVDHSGVEREDCPVRRKLVDQLVQYFEIKLKELQ